MSTRAEMKGALGALLRRIRVSACADDFRDSTVMDYAERVYRDGKPAEPIAWTRFEQRAHSQMTERELAGIASVGGCGVDALRAWLDEAELLETLWVNSRYQVARRDLADGLTWLSIKRIDQEPVHSWRDLQRIKNELCGPECEAVELYPAESRRVDTSNQYHLWVMREARSRFNFGFTRRLVSQGSVAAEHQEPLEAAPTPTQFESQAE
jgi:hypothetical protein